jgi:hypothetical protein
MLHVLPRHTHFFHFTLSSILHLFQAAPEKLEMGSFTYMASMGDMDEYIQLLVTYEGERQLGEINITWKIISPATSMSQDSYGNAPFWF